MFVRTVNQASGKVSILIVESIRKSSGQVCQKQLRHIATVLPSEVERFKEMAEYIKAEMEHERLPKLFPSKTLAEMVISSRQASLAEDKPLPVNLSKLREESRIVSGIHDIYGSLYDKIGFSRIFKSCPVSKSILKDIAMARLAKPCSKRSSCELLERDFGISIPLEKVYRMLDTLTAKRIHQIQELCWHHTKELFTEEIKVMFYDCTTLYFESFTEDELRSFGYSKDHKFNQGQVLLALLVTREGLPVGYEVFPGNMSEIHTLKYAIEKIKTRYGIKKVVIVADSGLLCKENISLLEQENLEYVMGARLKSLSLAWQNKILDNKEFDKKVKEDDLLRIATYSYSEKRRLIVTHSTKRAAKDRKDREKAIERLKRKLEESKKPQSLISNFGYKKYISIDGNAQLQVNTEKLERETLWDGLHGIFTNIDEKTMSAEDILTQYHGLWQVEESFRISKHDLRMRPVFHWTAQRIHAHIAICFVAFSLIRFLQYKIKQHTGENFSAERISEELYRVQESILRHKINYNRYVIPSKPSEDATKIYESMNLKRNVVPFKLNK
jgi:transposase